MGMSSSASVGFGIDLGCPAYTEWNFDLGGEYELPAPYGEDFDLDDLFEEFAGFTEAPVPWASEDKDPAQYQAWSDWLDRKRAALKVSGLWSDHYGHEYSGYIVGVGEHRSVNWGVEPIDMPTVTDEQLAHLKDFILFLDSKGLRLKGEFREPRLLLFAAYG